jgi:hypothetical protein
MRSMYWQLGILGTISAFAYRHRETNKTLCRGDRSQDLPNTDLQPAVRHLRSGISKMPQQNALLQAKRLNIQCEVTTVLLLNLMLLLCWLRKWEGESAKKTGKFHLMHNQGVQYLY